MGFTRGLLMIGTVFAVGLGAGFAWKQGWLPVEFPPPQTGVLDEADETTVPVLGIAPAIAETQDETTSELSRFEGLTEPPPQSAPLAAPRAMLVDATVTPASDERPQSPKPSPLRARETPPRRLPAAPEANEITVEPRRPSLNEIANAAFASDAPSQTLPTDPAEILALHKELSTIYWKEPSRRAEIQKQIDETARLIFFAPQPHFIEPYVIQSGDRLDTIAAKQKLSWEFVSRLNGVDPKRIRAGNRLKMVRGPFAAVVELNDFSLTVHLQGYYVKRYSVGIGKDGSTPLGKFPVLDKVVNPPYTDPQGRVIDGDDPQNPLGERWISLGNSYGIHGTIEPESIGKATSRGCLRLRDADILEVYDFLIVGSEVVIRQ